jgi:hypothetical protein
MEPTKLMQEGSTIFLGAGGALPRPMVASLVATAQQKEDAVVTSQHTEVLGFLLAFIDGSGESLHSFRLTRQQLVGIKDQIVNYLGRSGESDAPTPNTQTVDAAKKVEEDKPRAIDSESRVTQKFLKLIENRVDPQLQEVIWVLFREWIDRMWVDSGCAPQTKFKTDISKLKFNRDLVKTREVLKEISIPGSTSVIGTILMWEASLCFAGTEFPEMIVLALTEEDARLALDKRFREIMQTLRCIPDN